MNRITQLFKIKYPIVQGGMIWCSGWKLASAVSNNGGLGLIGSGSMYPEVLRDHIKKCKLSTDKPFGVNLPLIYPNIEDHIEIIFSEKVPIVFTSAGDPSKYTSLLRENGIIVAHVVSSLRFAIKCQDAGVDVIVGEGFEAGGHNGQEETTTMCLIPHISENIDLPLLAAGGIYSGKSMLAAMALGADGVQICSRFVATEEASAHINFKNKILQSDEGDTVLSLKKLTSVRLLKNLFYEKIVQLESKGASVEDFRDLLGKGRSKKGMFEGDLNEGELEIGQVSSMIKEIDSVENVIQNIILEFIQEKEKISNYNL